MEVSAIMMNASRDVMIGRILASIFFEKGMFMDWITAKIMEALDRFEDTGQRQVDGELALLGRLYRDDIFWRRQFAWDSSKSFASIIQKGLCCSFMTCFMTCLLKSAQMYAHIIIISRLVGLYII